MITDKMASETRRSSEDGSEVADVMADDSVGRLYTQTEITTYFLGGVFTYFTIGVLNPYGYFLYKDLPYIIQLYAQILSVISIVGSFAILVGFIYLKWVSFFREITFTVKVVKVLISRKSFQKIRESNESFCNLISRNI